MRIAYLDCFAGISGDMFLGALLDAGVPAQVMQDAVAALELGASLRVEKVDRSGIAARKVHVLVGDRPADAPAAMSTRQQSRREQHSHAPQTQHLHKGGHPHVHEGHEKHTASAVHEKVHEHAGSQHEHGRSLSVIRTIIQGSSLQTAVKQTAIHAFELLGAAEAKIHNVPIDEIHFHEVGAIDAIVDIVAASAGIHALSVKRWHASAVNVGGGTVECAHGTFPVPAPATADLLRGAPTYSAHLQMELVTPTGAALLQTLAPAFGPQPAMRVEGIGYGAGTRDPAGFPNVLRLLVGEADDAADDGADSEAADTISVLETALDDMTPQLLAAVAEQALAAGALDVMLTPAVMKKGRPGTLLTVLARPGDCTRLEELLLTQTTTLGVRIRQERRRVLDRSFEAMATPYGEVRMKLGTLGGEVVNAAPEFEDCRAAAEAHQVSVKQVQQAAVAAWVSRSATRARQ